MFNRNDGNIVNIIDFLTPIKKVFLNIAEISAKLKKLSKY